LKSFLITMDFCLFCPEWKIAKVLAQADIDMLDIKSGDTRVKIMERHLGRMTRENIPLGIVKNTFFNSSRDLQYMYILLKE